MPRKFFKHVSLHYRKKKDHPWYLKPFDYLLSHPIYFSAARRPVCGGLWIGLFVGMLPIPGQTILAVLAALTLRVNIPVAAVVLWVSNPLTFVPIFYLAYKIGTIVLNVPVEPFPADLDLDWLMAQTDTILKPMFTGAVIMGLSTASIAYLLVSAVWHVVTIRRYRRRHHRKAANIGKTDDRLDG